MHNYHLTPKEGGWALSPEGADPVFEAPTKSDAVKRATEHLEQHGGSLKIHKEDGTIEEERTYPRSADPAKSPG